MTSFTDTIKSHIVLIVALVVSLLALSFVLIFVFTRDSSDTVSVSNSYSEEKQSIKECTQNLLDCIAEGDSENAMNYCNKKSASTLGLSNMDSEAFKSELLEEIGITKKDLYSPTSKALDSMIDTASADFVRNSSMSKVSNMKKDKDGKVTGELELTISGISDFNSLSFSDSVNTANDKLVTYINSDMDNLMNNLDSQGSDNLKIALINHSLVDMFNDMTDKISSIPSTQKHYLLTVSVTKGKKGNLSSKIEKVSLTD